MKTTRLITTAVFSILLLTGVAWAGSIWAKAKSPKPLHADDTASRIGDILTIIIDERTTIDNKSERNLEKSSSRKTGVKTNVPLMSAINTATGGMFKLTRADVDMSADNKFDGKADYGNERKMIDQITVTVADVLPNGNLVVVGTRERKVDDDKQVVQVSGVVRTSDITFANTVRSDKVAEFKIAFKDGYREKRFTKPGWFGRILNLLNPF